MNEKIVIRMNTKAIRHLKSVDVGIADLIGRIGELEYTLHDENPYGFLVHEILEQMLSTKAAKKIHGRLEELCNGKIESDVINKLTDEQVKSIGTSIQKVKYIRSLTNAVIEGKLDFKSLQLLSDAEVINELTKIQGIGNWTAKMYLIFVLDRRDVLPFEDGAFLQSYRWLYNTSDTAKESIIRKCDCWKPYSSVAARYMYIALDSGLTKEQRN